MIRFLTIMACLMFTLSGCINPNVNAVKDTKASTVYFPPVPKPVPEQPKKDPDAYKATDSGKTYSLTLKNADIKDVLMLLSKESGTPIIQEKHLQGTVKIEARNKKLGELLFAVLKPLGYTATVENGMIMVGRPQLETRTFRVNYLKDKRNSSSNMNVSGFSAGSVSVTSTGQSDFWGSLENSLEMLVFGTTGKGKRDGGGFSVSEAEKKGETKSSSATVSTQSKTKAESTVATETEDSQFSIAQPAEGQAKQVVVNEIAGIIQVTDFSENLDKIASFLSDVEEGSKRQVLIQAHIMEVGLKDSYSMGIDWKYILDKTKNLTFAQALVPSTPSNVFKLSAVGSDFGVLLDAMKEQGNVNMLSSPKISALNNQKAVIKLTTKQVSWVSSKTTQNNAIGGQDTFTTTPQIDEVGIFLDVTPQIGPDNQITMQIHPSVSEIAEISVSPDKTSTKPIINIREIDTMVDAKAGETIVIAGLISDKLNETKRSVPLLGDIPYIGALFSYNKQERAKAELVIMMTPYILNTKSIDEIRAEHEQRIRTMGGAFHLINNLGSMVTEKTSRDWMMNIPTVPAVKKIETVTGTPAQPETVIHTIPAQKIVPKEQPVVPAVSPVEKKSELTKPAAPQAVTTQAPTSLIVPAESREIKKPAPEVPGSVTVVDSIQESATSKKTSPRTEKSTKPTLESITQHNGNIHLMLSNMKSEPKILRESKNRRIIIKLPGVQSGIGNANLMLDTLGFDRAKVARHNDGIWVVLHSSEKQLPQIETHVTTEGLMIVAAPPVAPVPLAAIIPSKKAVKRKQPLHAESAATVVPAKPSTTAAPVTIVTLEQPIAETVVAKPAVESVKPVLKQQVAVTSTTTSGEQALYRIGVAAYKSGNCNEAIKQLSSFIASYPDSAFAGDAAVYRSDCLEKIN